MHVRTAARRPISIAGLGATLVIAAVFAVVALALDASPFPAMLGALFAGLLEVAARPAARPGPPVPTRSVPTNDSVHNASPSADIQTGVDPTPVAGFSIPPALEPEDEVPCSACGLYPSPAPAAIAGPMSGAHRQSGPR